MLQLSLLFEASTVATDAQLKKHGIEDAEASVPVSREQSEQN